MTKFSKLFLFIFLFVAGSCYSAWKTDADVKPGNVTYFFESGKMQCLSEVTPEGDIVVLIKSLKSNTQVKFNRIYIDDKKNIMLSALMLVEEETKICAGWMNMQEINIAIDPQPVEKITLSGKTLYQAKNITVLE